MKISIIIPTYNQIDTLCDSIESALNQTVKCEIIVIDDGSTDGSGKIADGYKGRGVKVIHQVNKGLPSARNTGIMNTTGDYILPLDSDDIFKENLVEEILKKIEETGADIIAPSFKCFGVTNQEVILGEFTIEDLKTANRIAYFCAIKKDVLLEVGGYNPKMVWGYEDYDLWFDLLKRNKILAIIKEPLVMYRTKKQSMWTESIKHHDELMNIIKNNHKELFI